MRHVLTSIQVGLGILVATLSAFADGAIVTTPPKKLIDVCRERTMEGPKKVAVEACEKAIEVDSSAPAVLAMVRALLSGSERPTTDDLGKAGMLARALHRRFPDDPAGYVAECEIASKLGDLGLFKICRAEVARRVPNHLDLARMSADIEKLGTPSSVWVAWWLFAAACATALGHAIVRFVRGRPKRTRRAQVLAAAFLVVHLSSGGARAEAPVKTPTSASSAASAGAPGGVVVTPSERKGLSQWGIDPTSPEKSVPTPEQRDGNPLEYGYFVMDLTALGQRAVRLGDHREAVKYYRALARAAPERSIAFTKLCTEYEALGEIDHAIAACRMAIARPGTTPADYNAFIRLAFTRPGKLHPELAMDLEDLVEELRKSPATKASAERINCELGARTQDVKRLEACVATLGKGSENDAKAVTYRWVLALERKNYAEAEALVAQAKKTTMKPEGVEKMKAATLAAEPFVRRWVGTWQRAAIALTVLLVLAGIVFAVRRSARRPRARAVAGGPPGDEPSAASTA